MQRVLLVSTCLRYDTRWGRFNFKGYYKGVKINEVRVRLCPEDEFHIGHDYVIYLELEHIQQNTMWGRALKWKNLTNQH